MVEQMVTLFTYLPFGRRRLGFDHRLDQAGGVFDQLGRLETDLADGHVNHAGFVHAELHFAGLDFLHRVGDVLVTVPVFGLGIRPRGPSTLPSLPTDRIMSGVAITASKSVQPSP